MELNVIENYQAGEIRSTKNLSGDESFIGSLSLALGLSQMASRNVRVDSLFLDEGFGTLDDEALETMLSTLVELHQASKPIDVISQSWHPRSTLDVYADYSKNRRTKKSDRPRISEDLRAEIGEEISG